MPCSLELPDGWRACRASASGEACAGPWLSNIPQLPTTALSTLLAAGELGVPPTMDLFYSKNLARVPDINRTGPEFYTLWYERELPYATLATQCRAATGQLTTHATLRLEGVNYRAASASIDGMPLLTVLRAL